MTSFREDNWPNKQLEPFNGIICIQNWPTVPNTTRNIARHSLQMVINITTIGILITVFSTIIHDFNYNLIKFERYIRSKEEKKEKWKYFNIYNNLINFKNIIFRLVVHACNLMLLKFSDNFLIPRLKSWTNKK